MQRLSLICSTLEDSQREPRDIIIPSLSGWTERLAGMEAASVTSRIVTVVSYAQKARNAFPGSPQIDADVGLNQRHGGIPFIDGTPCWNDDKFGSIKGTDCLTVCL